MKFTGKSAFHKGSAILMMAVILITLFSCDKPILGPDSTGNITGTVRDYATNKVIANVNITTNPPTSSLVTNNVGQFKIQNIASGNYSVNASKFGYTDNSVTVNVVYGSQTEAVIFLKPTSAGSSSGTYPLDVKIVNWTSRAVTSDSNYVDVQYKVSNIGTDIINNYNIYFRIQTSSKTYEHEETGTNLNSSESNISNFSQYVYNNKADSVKVEGTWSN